MLHLHGLFLNEGIRVRLIGTVPATLQLRQHLALHLAHLPFVHNLLQISKRGRILAESVQTVALIARAFHTCRSVHFCQIAYAVLVDADLTVLGRFQHPQLRLLLFRRIILSKAVR